MTKTDFTAEVTLGRVRRKEDVLKELIRVASMTHMECFGGKMESFVWEGSKLILRCKKCHIEKNVSVSPKFDQDIVIALIKFFTNSNEKEILLKTDLLSGESGNVRLLKKTNDKSGHF